MVEAVAGAVAVLLVIVGVVDAPVFVVTEEVGQLVVVAYGGIESLVFEEAVQEQVYARVAGGGVGVLLLDFSNGFCPGGEVVEVEAVGIFAVVRVVYRQLGKRRDWVSEA